MEWLDSAGCGGGLEGEAEPSLESLQADAYGCVGEVVGADAVHEAVQLIERAMADLENRRGGFGSDAVEQQHEADAFGAGPAFAAEGAALAVLSGTPVAGAADQTVVLEALAEGQQREEKGPDLALADRSIISGTVSMVPTGRRIKRLRCVYHPNYAARVRAPGHVPEFIDAPTPEERYAALMDVAAGKRTKWGYYPGR